MRDQVFPHHYPDTKLGQEDRYIEYIHTLPQPNILIEDNNGNVFLAGAEYGADVTGGTVVTGGAMADMSGYTLSFTGMEKAPANFINRPAVSGVYTNTVAADIATAGFTIVPTP